MATLRISNGSPDLTPVFGALDDMQSVAIGARLEAADKRLATVQDALAARTASAWHTDGVVLETSESGQASIDVVLEEASGKITFSAQLRPWNYFPTEETMWQPGRPPMVMAKDAWDVDGEISVRFKTRVAGRPATIQQQVVELGGQRYGTPADAADAFAAVCGELADQALSREPTVDAWKPPDAGEAAQQPEATTSQAEEE